MPPSDTGDTANPYARRGTWGRAAGEIPTVTPGPLPRTETRQPPPKPAPAPQNFLVSPLKPQGAEPAFLTAKPPPPLSQPAPASQGLAIDAAPLGLLTTPIPRADAFVRPAPQPAAAQPWLQPSRPIAQPQPPIRPAPAISRTALEAPPSPQRQAPTARPDPVPAPTFSTTPVFAQAPRRARGGGLSPRALLIGGGVVALAGALAAFLLLGRAGGPADTAVDAQITAAAPTVTPQIPRPLEPAAGPPPPAALAEAGPPAATAARRTPVRPGPDPSAAEPTPLAITPPPLELPPATIAAPAATAPPIIQPPPEPAPQPVVRPTPTDPNAPLTTRPPDYRE